MRKVNSQRRITTVYNTCSLVYPLPFTCDLPFMEVFVSLAFPFVVDCFSVEELSGLFSFGVVFAFSGSLDEGFTLAFLLAIQTRETTVIMIRPTIPATIPPTRAASEVKGFTNWHDFNNIQTYRNKAISNAFIQTFDF